jgi:hypothetical protein
MPGPVSMAAAGVIGIFGGEALCLAGPLTYERQVHVICHVILYGGMVCVAVAAVMQWRLPKR